PAPSGFRPSGAPVRKLPVFSGKQGSPPVSVLLLPLPAPLALLPLPLRLPAGPPLFLHSPAPESLPPLPVLLHPETPLRPRIPPHPAPVHRRHESPQSHRWESFWSWRI